MKKILLLLVFPLLLSACGAQQTEESSPEEVVDAGPQRIALITPEEERAVDLIVEVADTLDEQAMGLMYREELADDAGMLFLFEESRVLTFWMKNTLIPLDIIFFDNLGVYVSHQTMEICEGDDCPGYQSGLPSSIALEVNAGSVEQWGIGDGWRIALPIN